MPTTAIVRILTDAQMGFIMFIRLSRHLAVALRLSWSPEWIHSCATFSHLWSTTSALPSCFAVTSARIMWMACVLLTCWRRSVSVSRTSMLPMQFPDGNTVTQIPIGIPAEMSNMNAPKPRVKPVNHIRKKPTGRESSSRLIIPASNYPTAPMSLSALSPTESNVIPNISRFPPNINTPNDSPSNFRSGPF